MAEQVVLNLKEAVKDEINKADLNNKEYGFEVAKDLFVNMRLTDINKYFGNSANILKRIADGKVSFEEAEKKVLEWRKDSGVKRE